ncbi:MAG: hypothetical protein WDO06_09600 [Actinomycetota bacterium]
MPLNRTRVLTTSYVIVGLGLALGIAGWVKIGMAILAIGAGAISLINRPAQKVERFLPIALAVALLVLAMALPVTR